MLNNTNERVGWREILSFSIPIFLGIGLSSYGAANKEPMLVGLGIGFAVLASGIGAFKFLSKPNLISHDVSSATIKIEENELSIICDYSAIVENEKIIELIKIFDKCLIEIDLEIS